MEKVTRLAVFDFDGTLVDTPLPDTGRGEYEQKTGKPWPHHGWWGREDSLDHTIFDIPVIPSVIADYEKQKEDPNTAVIMLTGRMQKLADKVINILDKHELEFDGHYFNRGGSTDEAKIKTMEKILDEYPNIQEIEMWDDRLEHIPTFEKWGREQVESGRLKDFSINVVPSGRH